MPCLSTLHPALLSYFKGGEYKRGKGGEEKEQNRLQEKEGKRVGEKMGREVALLSSLAADLRWSELTVWLLTGTSKRNKQSKMDCMERLTLNNETEASAQCRAAGRGRLNWVTVIHCVGCPCTTRITTDGISFWDLLYIFRQSGIHNITHSILRLDITDWTHLSTQNSTCMYVSMWTETETQHSTNLWTGLFCWAVIFMKISVYSTVLTFVTSVHFLTEIF